MLPPDTSSQTVFGIPSSHHHCFLENFDWEGKQNQEDALDEFLDECVSRWSSSTGAPSPHLILYGPPGTGKTHISVGIYRRAVLQVGTLGAHWLHMPTLCDAVKRTFNMERADDPFELMKEATDIVVVDDLFGRSLSPWELENVVFRVVDTAHQNGAALVVTMNQTIDEMSHILTPHEVSRILENSIALEFSGEDRRL